MTQPPAALPELTLTKFFKSAPPRQRTLVPLKSETRWSELRQPPSSVRYRADLQIPEIELECAPCRGPRIFAPAYNFSSVNVYDDEPTDVYIKFVCRNCRRFSKTYSVRLTGRKEKALVEAEKFGEIPFFGVTVPLALRELLDRANLELLEKALLSEAQGLGVGAFTYYRRILDNQRVRLFDRVIDAAKKLGADNDLVVELGKAREERQFTKAVEMLKAGLSASLYVNGHYPLTLLHDAVSDGLHADTDAACMEYAQTIRLVLADLLRRIETALLEVGDVQAAVNKLLQRKAAKQKGQSGTPQAPTPQPDQGDVAKN